MYTNEIDKIAKKIIPNFIGVFPLDKLPKHLGRPPKSFILNTDTSNLNGTHWLAVSYEKGGIIHAFDPFGICYPPLLTSYLHRIPNVKVIYNRIMFQYPNERNCGIHCLTFLKMRADHYKQW